MEYKITEIEEYFQDWIENQDKDWILENKEDLHHYAFNENYYIIGTCNAKQWIGDHAFDVIDFIKQYEDDNFGEVHTDFADPEKVVNMYAYIIGEEIVRDYINKLEEVA